MQGEVKNIGKLVLASYFLIKHLAQVAELVDALASGASGCEVVEVRVFSWAPILF